MKGFRVLAASLNPTTGFIEVVKEITADDNSISLNLHAFHPETPEWKAAELGLTDLDEIIDGIIHEPFFDIDVQPLQTDVETARANHRASHANAKSKFANKTPRNTPQIKAQFKNLNIEQRHIDAVDNDPFQVMRDLSHFHPEVIAVKQEHTDKVRAANAKVRQDIQALQEASTPSERAAALRDRLKTHADGKNRQLTEVTTESPPLPPIILGEKRGRGKS